MNNDTKMSSGDTTRFDDANDDTIWDSRADMDDDGDVDASDETLYDAKYSDWSGANPSADPRQAFSDKGNPFMFQGIPHFALDTSSAATEGKLMLNHHRARFADPVTGRWTTRDPLTYFKYLPNRPPIPNTTKAVHFSALQSSLLAADEHQVKSSSPLDTSITWVSNESEYGYLANCPTSVNDNLGLCSSHVVSFILVPGTEGDAGAHAKCAYLGGQKVLSGHASGCTECVFDGGKWTSTCVACDGNCWPLHCQCNPFGVRLCLYDGGTGCSCRCINLPIP
jgi:hypothetical protein